MRSGTGAVAAACRHCGLPLGRFGRAHEVRGETCWFCCYGCCLAYQVHCGERHEPEAAATLIRLGIGGFLAMNVMLASLMMYTGAFDSPADGDGAWVKTAVHWLSWLLATPLVVLLGKPFLAGALASLRERRLGTDALVCIGVGAAYLYSAVQVLRGSDLVYFDTAGMVLLLFTLGRYLEALARAKAARSVAPMLAAERAEVCVVRDGAESRVGVTNVVSGELVRVLAGERIAVDGLVVEGHSACDEAIITGQAQPRAKGPGATVHAGSLNGNGVLLIRATRDGTQTRWIHISRLVREALAQKSLAGNLIDAVVARFIPAVVLLACVVAWYWSERVGIDAALLAGIAVLVVACPCSLGLAAPLAHTFAIGQAAERGILVRGGGVLEKLARLRAIVFDKTGTLTSGGFHVATIATDGVERADLLARVAPLAHASSHPVARAIAACAAQEPGPRAVSAMNVRGLFEQPGAGVRADVDGAACALGSIVWMRACGFSVPAHLLAAPVSRGPVAYAGWSGYVRARFDCEDVPAADAHVVLARLREAGLSTLLASGDRPEVVAEFAASMQVDEWHAGLVPEDKVALLRARERRCGPLAMVGDGLNDGPVLAAASVGIAVGHATDLAKQSADVVLPRDALARLPWLIDLARSAQNSVRANLVWAFGYNAVALTLAASGLLQPVFAAALMAGSSVLVAARSWRAGQRALPDETPSPSLPRPVGRTG